MTCTTDPQLARQFALDVVVRLREAGHEALWAGGCVRDQLLDQRPKDYDVATDAQPHAIRKIFGRRRTLTIGAAFGVVTVLGPRGAGQIEVATFRRDEGYSDGRHPDRIAFSTPEEDAARRDFTINGIFYDPVQKTTIDYVGGEADIKAGRVRCIGDPHERINEDKLRMLRAIRFATTLGFAIDPPTQLAIKQHAEEINCVSAERIAAEMRRVVGHPQRQVGMGLVRSTGLWRVILPEYADLDESAQTACWAQMLGVLDALRTNRFATALAAVLWPLAQRGDAEGVVMTLANRWRLSNGESKLASWLLNNEATLRRAKTVRWPTLQRVLIHPSSEDLVELGRAVELYVDGNDGQVAYSEELRQLPGEKLNPVALISGHDLMQAGFPRGPLYRVILETIRDAQLEGTITTRQQAIKFAKRNWKP